MIRTVMMISLRRLMHNRVELLLAFVVPIAFFSIFALIFGKGIGSGTTPRIKVVAVDEADSESSRQIMQSLKESESLRFMRSESGNAMSRQQAERLVRAGTVTMAIVLSDGKSDPTRLNAQLLADASDQVAGQVVSALVGRSIMMTRAKNRMATLSNEGGAAAAGMPEIDFSLVEANRQVASNSAAVGETAIESTSPPRPMRASPTNVSPMRPSTTLQQRGVPVGTPIRQPTSEADGNPPETNEAWRSFRQGDSASRIDAGASNVLPASYESSSIHSSNDSSNDSSNATDGIGLAKPTDAGADEWLGDLELSESIGSPVEIVDVIGDGKSNPVVSMYAAGIAVMFLLFGATGGGGALLEEKENQTLDRLLSTRLTMDQLILGKWFYLTLLGVVQVCVMFTWGQLVFGIDVTGHWDGFLIMTVVTSFAAAAFGLLLATLCKTRGQLNGLSVILILSMSALGGSMVPRYVMSQRMQEAGLWTFNAWALDGYDKVFWRELPVSSLWPQLVVLTLCGVGFLVVARLLAFRWEQN